MCIATVIPFIYILSLEYLCIVVFTFKGGNKETTQITGSPCQVCQTKDSSKTWCYYIILVVNVKWLNFDEGHASTFGFGSWSKKNPEILFVLL
jgi:hypothetical protein